MSSVVSGQDVNSKTKLPTKNSVLPELISVDKAGEHRVGILSPPEKAAMAR